MGEGVLEYFLLPLCLSREWERDLVLDLDLDLEWEREERESRRCFFLERRWDEREWLRLRLLDRLALLPLRFLPEFLSGEEERFRVGDVTVLLGVLFLEAGLNVALA